MNVDRSVNARELAPASVPLAPDETPPSGQTEVVTKDGRHHRVDLGRFQRTETEIIARDGVAGLRSFPIGEVRRVVLAEVVERTGEPESQTSVHVSGRAVGVILGVVVAVAIPVGLLVLMMSGLRSL